MPSSGRFRTVQCVVPTAETESGRWFGKLRRRNGAALALIFHKPRAQWPGRNRTQALLILRAGNVLPNPRGDLRNGGPGESRHWRTKFASAASPGDPLVTFPSLGKSLAARRRRNSPRRHDQFSTQSKTVSKSSPSSSGRPNDNQGDPRYSGQRRPSPQTPRRSRRPW